MSSSSFRDSSSESGGGWCGGWLRVVSDMPPILSSGFCGRGQDVIAAGLQAAGPIGDHGGEVLKADEDAAVLTACDGW
jgi:hypothetical protein